MSGDRDRCLAGGMDGYMSKPINPQTLFSVVEADQLPEPAAPAVPAAGAAPTFDKKALLERVAGDEQLMIEVINIFLEDCPPQLGGIRRAVEAKDPGLIRTTAHALKGAAGNLGANGLFEAAGILERIGAESRTDGAEAAWRRLSAEATAVLDALRNEIAASAEPSLCAR
jgi:two-component system, sensor histidine kinase and response regulator